MCFKSCGCQKIDNANGESDSATINTKVFQDVYLFVSGLRVINLSISILLEKTPEKSE